MSASAKPPRERGMSDTTRRHNSFPSTPSQSACNSRDEPPFWARFTIQGVELRNPLLRYIASRDKRTRGIKIHVIIKLQKQSLYYWPDFKSNCYLKKQGSHKFCAVEFLVKKDMALWAQLNAMGRKRCCVSDIFPHNTKPNVQTSLIKFFETYASSYK